MRKIKVDVERLIDLGLFITAVILFYYLYTQEATWIVGLVGLS